MNQLPSDTFYTRYRVPILLLALLVAPFLWYGSQRALESNRNDPMDWLPEHFDETQRLMEFGRLFGSDSFFMISWPGATLEDPRISTLCEELRKIRFDGRPLFGTVSNGADLVADLRRPPLELTREQAIGRLQGILVGRDGETTCVVGALRQFSPEAQHYAFDAVWKAIDRTPELDRESVKLAGTAFDGVFIDRASQSGLYPIMITCYCVSFVLLLASFRNLPIALSVMVVAILNQYLTMSLVWLTGSHMDSILLVAPSLVYVLSISTGVHLVNYYRDALHHHAAVEAPTWAVRFGLTPCVVAAVTTALGLVSLLTSYLIPIERFGIYASVAVLISAGTVLFFLPACLAAISPKRWRIADNPEIDDEQARRHVQRRVHKWTRLVDYVAPATPAVLILVVIGGVAGVWGLSKMQASARIHDMFSPRARVIQDYVWLERELGPLAPMEVVLRFPQDREHPGKLLDKLRLVGQAHQAVASIEGVQATLSVLNFAPAIPSDPARRLGVRDLVRQRLLERRLQESRDTYEELRVLHADSNWESWRISGRVSSSETTDMKRSLRRVRAVVDPIVAQAAEEYPGVKVLYSGTMPIVEKTQEQLLDDLTRSFIVAFVFIAIAIAVMLMIQAAPDFRAVPSWPGRLLIVVRCILAALVAMIPNVAPCVVVFGAMGWFGIKIEIGTLMTATVAMGVAVDDTLHFVTWFRRSALRGSTRLAAIAYSYRHCASAMIETSAICGLGLLAFTLSEFGPMQRFAWLMFSMLLTALLADLIVLPALLYSQLGGLFTPVVPSTEHKGI